jgi:hypothetical protein
MGLHGGCMPVRTDDHRCLLHLFRISSFYNIHHVKATQCRVAIFPSNTGALPLDFFRHFLREFSEISRMANLKAWGEIRLRITYVAIRHLLHVVARTTRKAAPVNLILLLIPTSP